MLGDLEHALSRRNSRTWSERENQQQGVQLRCSACGAVNNTCDGMVCSNCKNDLDIPYAEVNIEQAPDAEEFVLAVNDGNRTVPTVVFPDGSTAAEPSGADVQERLQ